MIISKPLRWCMIALGLLLAARGIGALVAPDSSASWTQLLGIGGLANAEARFGGLGKAMRILYLIESRLWVIVAFPMMFRLAWGRDVAIAVAAASILTQGFRLLLGAGFGAVVWIGIFIGIIALFATLPQIKAYFAASETAKI